MTLEMNLEHKDIIEQIESVLEECRIYLREDGGDVEFARYEPETQVVELRLLGRCRACPMSIMTLRAGIERVLIKKIPIIRRVESIR
jgi:Fe-S cluster biogenesis protein NfuA